MRHRRWSDRTLQPPQCRGSSVTFVARPVNSTPGGLMQLVAYGAQDLYVTGGG